MPISLTAKFYKTDVTMEDLQSYDLKVEITESIDMTKKVFIMQASVSPNQADVFVCIADPVDIEEFPEDAPALNAEIPYYRVDTITLRFRDTTTLTEVKALINEDLAHLVESLNASASLVEDEIITYAQ